MREGLRTTAASVLVFAAINMPFVLPDPVAWVAGVLTPQASPTFPSGRGPVGLFTSTRHVGVVVAVFTALMVLTVVSGWLLALRGRGG